jgi:hypothetical protein
MALDYDFESTPVAGTPTPASTNIARVVGTFLPSPSTSNTALPFLMSLNSVPLTAKTDYYLFNNATGQTFGNSTTFTYSSDNGTNQITMTSSTNLGNMLGQGIMGNSVPAGTFVTAVNTATVTLSQNLTGAGSGAYSFGPILQMQPWSPGT